MKYLAENNFKVISLEDFVKHLNNQRAFADKTVLITFDDGYQSIIDNALPVLKEYQFPFTVFINAKPIVQKLPPWMSWDELRELQKHNASIANHGYEHLHMIRLLAGESEAEWLIRITEDIEKNQSLLESELGVKLKALAYPYGEYDSTNIKPLLERKGYLGFAQHSGAVSVSVDQQAIPRFPFGGSYGAMEDFKDKVNALAIDVKSMSLKSESGKLLDDHVLTGRAAKPSLLVELAQPEALERLSCFYTGQGLLKKSIDGGIATFSLSDSVPPGRTRFNCTLPSDQKQRFYWFSQPLIQRMPDGQWYKE